MLNFLAGLSGGAALGAFLIWCLRAPHGIDRWPGCIRKPLAVLFVVAVVGLFVYVIRLHDVGISVGAFVGLLAAATWHRWRYGFWWDRYQ